MSFETRLANMLPGRRLQSLPVLLLVGDKSRDLHERRRSDCARLFKCESDWILVKGAAQAKCPHGCTHHRRVDSKR